MVAHTLADCYHKKMLGKPQKSIFLMCVQLRRGGGKGRAIKEKISSLKAFFPTAKVPTAIKLEGEGVQALP